jgi:tetratricopeptide (TPR) repeat protein
VKDLRWGLLVLLALTGCGDKEKRVLREQARREWVYTHMVAEGRRLYDRALSADPSAGQAGRAEAEGFFREAIDQFSQAVGLAAQPAEQARLHAWIGWIRRQHLGNLKGAVEAYEEAVRLDDRDRGHCTDLADTLRAAAAREENADLARARRERAAALYMDLLKRFPDDSSLWNELGVTMIDLEQHEEARRSLGKAVALRADYAQAWNNLGVALHASGASEEARGAYLKAQKLDPRYADPYYGMARLHLEAGRSAEAGGAFRDFLDRTARPPSDESVQKAVAYLAGRERP